ncbi:MAG: hypothetical protein GQ582_00930 [Methyloprofundus sp.]|nr:hypothetical protein [Methyloprofundus sp.]
MKNSLKLITFFIFTIASTNAFAYGSSSSKTACKKPKLSQFTPEHLAVVKPQSEFSFVASATTEPNSIVVNIKKQNIELNIEDTGHGYTVTGQLPAIATDYARINITSKGLNRCPAKEGWLLKIAE